jgi:hypothetical protein
MSPEEGSEVVSLYHIGEVVQVAGEYIATAPIQGFPSMPLLAQCKVASSTDRVVRPAPKTSATTNGETTADSSAKLSPSEPSVAQNSPIPASPAPAEEVSKSPPITGFSTYKNDKFGLTLDYPQFFVAQTSQNADEETFLSPDGKAQLTVAAHNNSGLTLGGYLRRATVNIQGKVLYQEAGNDWFTVVWRDGEKRGYLKMFVGRGSVNAFATTFPEGWRPEYDATLGRMEKSFKPGDTNRQW